MLHEISKNWLLLIITYSLYVHEIDCSQCPVQSTVMFLASGFRVSGPCTGWQEKRQIQDHEEAVQEESEKKDSNNWLIFEDNLGKSSTTTTDLIGMTKSHSQYIIDRKFSLLKAGEQPYHRLIKKHLYDLQKLAAQQQAHSPFVFTIERQFTSGLNACMYCGEKNFVKAHEHASWIDASSMQQASSFLRTPCAIEASCQSCKKSSSIWYTRKTVTLPILLVVLTQPSMYYFTERETFNLSGATYKLLSTLGTTKSENPFVELYNDNIRYHQGEKTSLSGLISSKADYGEGHRDLLWASIYRYQSLQELTQEKEESCCCAIS